MPGDGPSILHGVHHIERGYRRRPDSSPRWGWTSASRPRA